MKVVGGRTLMVERSRVSLPPVLAMKVTRPRAKFVVYRAR